MATWFCNLRSIYFPLFAEAGLESSCVSHFAIWTAVPSLNDRMRGCVTVKGDLLRKLVISFPKLARQAKQSKQSSLVNKIDRACFLKIFTFILFVLYFFWDFQKFCIFYNLKFEPFGHLRKMTGVL